MSSFDDHQAIVIDRATANMTPGGPNDDQSKSRCNGTRPTLTTVDIHSTTIEIVIILRCLRFIVCLSAQMDLLFDGDVAVGSSDF